MLVALIVFPGFREMYGGDPVAVIHAGGNIKGSRARGREGGVNTNEWLTCDTKHLSAVMYYTRYPPISIVAKNPHSARGCW